MEHANLYELISYIERGTNLHISMAFFGAHGSDLCALPHSHTIHSRPVCEIFKSTQQGLRRCMKCREYAIKRALRDKAPFSALCINGVFEYTYPICSSGEVIAIIFIGNILKDEGTLKLRECAPSGDIPKETMEYGFSDSECETVARIVEGYTLMLLEKHPRSEGACSTVIENVKSYVRANLEYDHKLSDIASLFFYSEAYLGRLFKRETGESFNDYLNKERIYRAKSMLRSELTVTEVAWGVGYNSVTYFNKVFKEATGMTPTEYRAKTKKRLE